MKKYIFSLLLFIPAIHFSQVIISPYIVYLDEQKRFGSFIVQNESNEEFEISISFIFGHPVSDSLGIATMRYYEEPDDSLPAIDKWIRAFPRNFLLNPRQRQVVRMTVRPPDTLKAGTYWTRIVTSSSPKSDPVQQQLNAGISAKINFVIDQITTVIYRRGSVWTGIDISSLENFEDSSSVYFLTQLSRTGNSPFFGNISIALTDTNGIEFAVQEEYVAVYYDMTKRITFDKSELPPGIYNADLKIILNEKVDIPESKLEPILPIIKTIQFEIVE